MTMRATSGIQYSGGGIGLKSAGVAAQSGVASSVTGTATETTLATVNIPANSVGANGRIRVSALFSCTASANAKSFRVRLAGNQLVNTNTTNAGAATFELLAEIWAANATNSQVCGPAGMPGVAGAALTSAVDMTQAQSLTITGQLAVTTETVTLLSYSVEVINP